MSGVLGLGTSVNNTVSDSSQASVRCADDVLIHVIILSEANVILSLLYRMVAYYIFWIGTNPRFVWYHVLGDMQEQKICRFVILQKSCIKIVSK